MNIPAHPSGSPKSFKAFLLSFYGEKELDKYFIHQLGRVNFSREGLYRLPPGWLSTTLCFSGASVAAAPGGVGSFNACVLCRRKGKC